MKSGLGLILVLSSAVVLRAEEIIVQKLAGDVNVRHGVAETWVSTAPGDVLKPDDTMKTGRNGSALIVVAGTQKISLPPDVIVDVADFRDLSRDDLMLKLAMEKVRSTSYEWKNEEMNIPNTTVVHGAERAKAPPIAENDIQVGLLRFNGTRVLFDNGFYSTAALKALEVFRLFPPLGVKFENRLMVAEALERANARGEALNEYNVLSTMEGLTSEQQQIVKTRIAQLRRQ